MLMLQVNLQVDWSVMTLDISMLKNIFLLHKLTKMLTHDTCHLYAWQYSLPTY